jgi:hypothetical protein
MAAYDEAAPGAVHRVVYESMVENTEAEVRRLLDYLGLPFEQSCLEFYNNDRAVRTASSEQVRRPIFKDGLEQWTHYDASARCARRWGRWWPPIPPRLRIGLPGWDRKAGGPKKGPLARLMCPLG